jgi:all-trans-retinol dehydrogenase (NAD+)
MPSITRIATTASACLLYILTLGPDRLRDPAISLLAGRNISVSRAKEILKTFLKLGLFLESNNLLNVWARNNWRVRNKEKWDWPNEVAVVTGGSGGIGVLIVKGLAKKGVKVAVLDLSDLPEGIKKCMLNSQLDAIPC